MRLISLNDLQAPAKVLEIDVNSPGPTTPATLEVTEYRSIWCLLRWNDYPLEVVYWDVSMDSRVMVSDLLSQVDDRIVAARNRIASIELPTCAGSEDALSLTVVICTRNRPKGLTEVLSSLSRQRDPNFKVLVVENGNAFTTTAGIVAGSGLGDCRCIVEERPGLSRARNRALAAVDTELVAWLDDDEVADPGWISYIKRGFLHFEAPVAVCGFMFPAELAYDAQVQFEQYGGFNKGRGLSPEVLRKGTRTDPLYPLPTFGSGGNMAFRTAALRALGGFDPCLGIGTKSCGGEETLVLSRLLSEDRTVLFWPFAITWHTHRRDLDGFRRQMYGCGAGLSAFYASVILHEPVRAFGLGRLVPHVIRDLRDSPDNRRVGQVSRQYPKDLLRARRRGYLEGGAMYLYESIRQFAGRKGGQGRLQRR